MLTGKLKEERFESWENWTDIYSFSLGGDGDAD